MKPLISVLMPVFNAEKYLREAIQSILNQTYKNIEFLIVDDASSDSSVNIIKEFRDPRIRFSRNDKNMGYVKTLNNMIIMAQGKYLARQDNDDISARRRLEFQVEFLEANSEYSLCGTNALIFGDRSTVAYIVKKDNQLRALLLFQNAFLHPSVMIRRLQDTNCSKPFYNEALTLAEDYAAWFYISQRAKIANIGRTLLKYRWHSKSESRIKAEQQIAATEIISASIFKYSLDWSLDDGDRKTNRLLMGNERLNIAEIAKIEIFLGKVLSRNIEIKYYQQTNLYEICLYQLVRSISRLIGVNYIKKLSLLVCSPLFKLPEMGLVIAMIIRQKFYRIYFAIFRFY